MLKYIWVFSLTFLFSQTYDYSLEDVNSSSDFFGQNIGPSFFDGQVTLHYFGHFNWGLCSTRFGQLDDLVNDLNSDGYNSVQLIGIGKSTHSSSLNNWTGSNNESVCIDPSPFSTWSDWGASQRDLIVLDTNGDAQANESLDFLSYVEGNSDKIKFYSLGNNCEAIRAQTAGYRVRGTVTYMV